VGNRIGPAHGLVITFDLPAVGLHRPRLVLHQ